MSAKLEFLKMKYFICHSTEKRIWKTPLSVKEYLLFMLKQNNQEEI